MIGNEDLGGILKKGGSILAMKQALHVYIKEILTEILPEDLFTLVLMAN